MSLPVISLRTIEHRFELDVIRIVACSLRLSVIKLPSEVELGFEIAVEGCCRAICYLDHRVMMAKVIAFASRSSSTVGLQIAMMTEEPMMIDGPFTMD
jgi:riboflavin synthase alpha subunit